jgi:UDP-glucose 4-epimerase
MGETDETDGGARRTVLLTGARGIVGAPTAEHLEQAGWVVRAFDLTDGDDILDADALERATAGCEAVVHAAAVRHDSLGTPADIVATNVLGTWHVLVAAECHRVQRVVTYSSIQVFGCSGGEGEPDYLPIDDDHPTRAARPYGMSKALVEEMCERWSRRTGIPTVVFRPAACIDDQDLGRVDPATKEFGAYVHVDDVANAAVRALEVPLTASLRLTLSAAGDVDTSRARDALGWRPARRLRRRDRLRQLLRR